MFELGRLGESVASIATRLKLEPRAFYMTLTRYPNLMMALKKGAQVFHDEYRISMVPLIKEAFKKKIEEGDIQAIKWGMDNMVMVNSEHPASLDMLSPSIINVTKLNTDLPAVKNEEERRARVESLLSVYMLNAEKNES